MQKFDKSTALWFIDENIARFRREIEVGQKGLASLMAIRDFIVSAQAPKTKRTFEVQSRTQGEPHFVSVDDGEWSCTCKAGQRTVPCWALRALERKSLTENGLYNVGQVEDDYGVKYLYTEKA